MGLVLLPFSHRPAARGNIPEIHLSSGDPSHIRLEWEGQGDRGGEDNQNR